MVSPARRAIGFASALRPYPQAAGWIMLQVNACAAMSSERLDCRSGSMAFCSCLRESTAG